MKGTTFENFLLRYATDRTVSLLPCTAGHSEKDYIYLNLLNSPNRIWYKMKIFCLILLIVYLFFLTPSDPELFWSGYKS